MNCVALLVFRVSKRDEISPLLSDLHRLSVDQKLRIRYKISTPYYNVISGSAPPYLLDLLQLYIPSRTLRSSAASLTFRVPHRRKKFQGQRTFSYIGPVTWDSLPFAVLHAQTLPCIHPNSRLTFSVYPNGIACPCLFICCPDVTFVADWA